MLKGLFAKTSLLNPQMSFALVSIIKLYSNENFYTEIKNAQKDFDEYVLQNKKPVILDFYAKWCNPCKILEPLLKENILKANGKIDMVKANIDEQPELAGAFKVQGVPTVYLIKDGDIKKQFVGLPGQDQLKEFFDEALKLS